MFLYSLLASNALEVFEPVAKWLTIAVLALAVLACVIVFFAKRQNFGKFAKWTVFITATYLLVLAIVMFSLDIAKNYANKPVDEKFTLLFLPLLVSIGLALVSLLAFALTAKFAPAKKKLCALCGGIVCAVALVAALVCLAVYYQTQIANDDYYNSDSASVKQISLYVSAILAIALIVGLAFSDKQKLAFDSRSLAFAGICVAMSYALSYIKLWDMPNGGSITLVSLLPLMLFSYMFGVKKGVFVGLVYGVLQAAQDPWIIHPAQFLLDYPVAFAAIGLAGLLKNVRALEKLPQVKFTVGALIAGTLRFVCHVLSGVFAFEVYAEGQNAFLYSLAYNSYVFIDVALVIAAGVFVLSSKAFVRSIERFETQKKTDQ